jgi:hypothetical protein
MAKLIGAILYTLSLRMCLHSLYSDTLANEDNSYVLLALVFRTCFDFYGISNVRKSPSVVSVVSVQY